MEEIYTRIEDYLGGVMSDTEQAVFEADVQADPVLAAALADLREAHERLARQWAQASDEAELSKILKRLGPQHFGAQSASPLLHPAVVSPARQPADWWWWAAIAIAAALLVWVILRPQGEPSERLYAEFRHFPEASFTLKSVATTPGGPSLERAATDFNQKKYAAALAALQAHLTKQPYDLDARFFAGLCQLELGQLAAAEATFLSYRNSAGVWVNEARWYLALTYLRAEKWQVCSEILLQIPPEHPRAGEVKRLVQELKGL